MCYLFVLFYSIQAACDSQCRFVFMNCSSPGGTNDIAAYRRSTLPDKVEGLPLTRYVVGDNAYTPTEHVLVPFSGSEKEEPEKDVYNYHLSQLRIRIEMCFGRLVSKWRILKAPLCVKVKMLLVGRIIYCCTRQHNFCINEGDAAPEIKPEDPKELPPEYYMFNMQEVYKDNHR